MGKMGKLFILVGLAFIGVGLLTLLFERLGLFHLPGDFEFSGRNWKVYFPLATSVLLSILLTALLWLIHWLNR
jgi:heme/copper-type cytochrome/quinol oxidase subunit 4